MSKLQMKLDLKAIRRIADDLAHLGEGWRVSGNGDYYLYPSEGESDYCRITFADTYMDTEDPYTAYLNVGTPDEASQLYGAGYGDTPLQALQRAKEDIQKQADLLMARLDVFQ